MRHKEDFIERYSGLVTFLLIYSYSLSFIIDILFRTSSHVLSYFTAFCGFVIILMAVINVLNKHTVYKCELYILIFAVLIIILATISSFRYTSASEYFSGTYNSMLVRTIPALIAGILVARRSSLIQLERFLIPLIVIVSLVLVVTVSKNKTGDVMSYIKLGIDRQTMSYIAVFMICWSIYCVIHFSDIDTWSLFKTPVWRVLLIIIAIVDIWPLFAGGGRGAIVILVAYLLFIVVCKLKPFHSLKGLIGLVIAIVAIWFIGQKVLSSSIISDGVLRITSLFAGNMDQSFLERVEIYKKSLSLFWEHPIIGGGPGSVICNIGIWSHNVFLDILADYGSIGFILFCCLLFKVFKYIFTNLKFDRSLEIAMMLGIGSFIMLCFSGSYLSDGGLWFLMSYAIAYRKYSYNMCKVAEGL